MERHKGLKLFDGLLKLRFMPDWSFDDDGQVISIGSPDGNAGINISLWTVRDESAAQDASGNLEAFMSSVGAQCIERVSTKAELASGRFRDKDGTTMWTATFYYDRKNLVLVSSTVSAGATQDCRDQAEHIVSSVQFRSKRRFFFF